MAKFTTIILCVVALSLTNVNAITEEEQETIKKALAPMLEECSKQHEVSGDDIKTAIKPGGADAVKPCFLGCVFKKIRVIGPNGLFDVETGLEKIKEFVKDPAERKKFEDIGKQCASVNDRPVSDGASGCERSTFLLTCILDHKVKIPL